MGQLHQYSQAHKLPDYRLVFNVAHTDSSARYNMDHFRYCDVNPLMTPKESHVQPAGQLQPAWSRADKGTPINCSPHPCHTWSGSS